MEFAHTSVLLEETIEGLAIKPDGIYVDGTLGGAGHSSHIAARLRTGRLIGIDQDAEAIEAATKRLEPWQEHVTLVRDNYCNLPAVLNSLGIDKVDGIMLDLGVSSYQLDNAERGFSYRYDTALDMRMDQRQTLTAKTIVNEWSQAELFRCIRDYGEDKFAQNIAKHIVQARERKPIETTGELNDIIRAAIPAKMRTSLQTHVSGDSDCLQQRAGGIGKFPGRLYRSAGSGWKALHHHLPFAGRQNCEKCLPQK